MGIWSKDEGVLDTRVLATHEDVPGQSAGTQIYTKESIKRDIN